MSIARALLAASLAALTACSPAKTPPLPGADCTTAGCPAGQACNPDTRRCVGTTAACGAGCPTGSFCNPVTNACTAGTCSTTTCPGGTCFSNACRVCGADMLCPAASSACGTAPTLTLAMGTTPLMGSFGGLPTGLVSSSYRTAVLRLEVQQETMLAASMAVRGISSLWTPDHEVRLVRSDCDSDVAISSGSPQAFSARYLAPGTYFLLVSGGDVDAVSWLVTLQASAATQPAGNTCAAPLPFTWDAATGAVSVHGTTVGNDQASWYGCDAWSGGVYPDVIYRLDLPVASYVNLSATYVTPSATYPTYANLALARATDCGGEQTCWSGPLVKSPLAAGSYDLIVTAGAAPGHAFDITGSILPWATNGTCATAAPIDLSSGTATVTGNLQYADAGTSVACVQGATTYAILDYALSTSGLGDQSLDVEVIRPGGGASYGVVLQRACESTSLADVVACDHGEYSGATSSTLSVDVLPAGDYSLSVGDYLGPFSMTVTRGPPRYTIPANDTCAAPQTIAISSSSPYAFSGDTRGADDTVGGACGGTDPGAGKDVAYHAAFTSPGWLTVRVSPSAGFDPVLRADAGCTGAPSGACANAFGPGQPEELVIPVRSSGGGAAFWVDGAGGTSGTFTGTAQLRYASSDDVCANVAWSMDPGYAYPDDLRDAWADGAGACAAAGPDVFYAYQNTGSGANVSFTVQPNAFDAQLRVLGSSCAVATCPALVDAAGPGGAETTPTVRLGRNEWAYVQVTTAGAGGAFTITANLN
jgi:hypothetical protein